MDHVEAEDHHQQIPIGAPRIWPQRPNKAHESSVMNVKMRGDPTVNNKQPCHSGSKIWIFLDKTPENVEQPIQEREELQQHIIMVHPWINEYDDYAIHNTIFYRKTAQKLQNLPIASRKCLYFYAIYATYPIWKSLGILSITVRYNQD